MYWFTHGVSIEASRLSLGGMVGQEVYVMEGIHAGRVGGIAPVGMSMG